MAAPMRRVLSVSFQNHGRVLTRSTKLFHGTYCQRNFILRFCNSASHISNIITRDSKVDKTAADLLEQEHVGLSGHIKYHSHPGVMRRSNSQLPARLVKAIQILLEKYPMKEVASKTDKLVRYLQQRHPPLGNRELTEKTREIESKVLAKDGDRLANLTGDELEVALDKHRKKVMTRLRQTVYHWKPMQYDAFTSYTYLMGRTASDYAVLLQCFTEIAKRDADFKPTSIYHYGSKVGSGIWAAAKIWKTIGEHYCVDESGHMNTIAQLLLQDGNEQERTSSIKGVHFRQFAPSPKEHKFSMVVSAYMLIEQPSEADRQHLVLDLWEMTEDYLVLIENGTGAGFGLINEARELILNLSKGETTNPAFIGHVFAPCPHDQSCPKLRVKNQPCLTECVMKEMDYTAKLSQMPKKNARYSYVIFKKGQRVKETEWPRMLHQIKASRHYHCHICLPCGEMQHVVITKGKFEKHLYNCAKHCDQGDRLPVSLSPEPLTTTTDDPEPSQTNDRPQDTDDETQNGYERADDQISTK